MQVGNKNVLITVNSTANFYKDSLLKNIKSLIEAGVNRKDILVVIGGFDDAELASEVEVYLRNFWNIKKIYAVKQNSCDHTLFNFLIDRAEVFDGFDYLFYMHDTCWVGSDFVKKLNDLTPKVHIDSFGLTESWSMNIALYNIKYLLSQKDEIRKAHNFVNTDAAVNYWKQWGAETEDYLMNRENGHYTQFNKTESITMENPYGKSAKRRTRYFECLDLYKSQSNWNGVQNQMNVEL
jgi:hypothetical protein